MEIKINNKIKVSENSKPLIIAEVSANHCGSKKIFKTYFICKKKWC